MKHFWNNSRRREAKILLIAALVFLPTLAHSQVVAFTGGTSTLLHTSGAQTDYAWGSYSGFLGLGYSDGWRTGGMITSRFKEYQFSGGDIEQKIVVDSDLFDGASSSFSSRGLQVSRNGETMSWRAFAGVNSSQQYQGFYQTYSGQDATGLFAYSWKVSDKLKFHSNNIVQGKFSSIESFRYTLKENWTVAAAAGVGRNSPYSSFGINIEERRYRFNASYSYLGDGFQRFLLVKTAIPERTGANVRYTFRPSRHWSFTASHENLASVQDTSLTVRPKIALNTLSAGGSIFRFRLNGSATNSTSGDLWTHTRTGSISRQTFNGLLNFGLIYTELINQYGNNAFTIATAEERVSNRLSLRQMFVHGENSPLQAPSSTQNTITAGGTFRSNRLTLGIEQQLIYNALPTAGKSVYTAWTVNLRFSLVHSLRFNVDSFIDQTGRMRYTSFLDGLLLAKGNEVLQSTNRSTQADFGKFLVKGIVQDEKGNPIWGICVHVDGETAYSDSTGQFYLRFRKGETYPVHVMVDQSLSPQRYELLSAPVSVRAESPDMAAPMVIVVRLAKGSVPPAAVQPRKRSALDSSDRTLVSENAAELEQGSHMPQLP